MRDVSDEDGLVGKFQANNHEVPLPPLASQPAASTAHSLPPFFSEGSCWPMGAGCVSRGWRGLIC